MWGGNAVRKFRYASLLVRAKNLIISERYEDARKNVDRIFGVYGERRADKVPIPAHVMRALVAWNLGEYDITQAFVRNATDKISRRLLKPRSRRHENELLYLKCYCWTLLYFTETKGASVRWSEFEDLTPWVCAKVDLSAVSGTIKRTFPVDRQMFASPEA
jgi:hypothetical protein